MRGIAPARSPRIRRLAIPPTKARDRALLARDRLWLQRIRDGAQQLAAIVLRKLPEHHAAEVVRADVARLDGDGLGIVVGDEGMRCGVPQEGRLCLGVPAAHVSLLAD